ncbi:hypothetical protein [Arthrobacter bambusae]|uniref:hypothetical protein n=1 Tax=Arthrobacter bambusae TaxID=1338426 RepID=UPI002784794B|nr:hypothetical protein [Arthrobacter bambusae]MDQ0241429.1 hypothetical protein [Arthrobacter bambusae]
MAKPQESNDPTEIPEVIVSPDTGGNDSLATLREQAQEIIDQILSSTDPDGERIRAKLRVSISRHPGRPDQALLEHLMNRDN